MRIQHNIMAMNSYRNYNNNASALGKNLEKLSSGYKINRAGDDAAGLAISEKMRAQIKGLSAAQKNVKDGISLVKTAEGAMQEIQDMLSRMKYLATQSSNGTYDNDVDRKALQDEVDQLKSEINRIADSANFNGIKLLDGSLSGSGSSSTSKLVAPTVDNFDLTLVPGTKAQTMLKVAKTSIGLGDFNVTVDLNGKQVTYTYKVQATKGGTMEMVDANGKVITASTAGSVKFSGTKVHVSKGFQFKASVFNKDLADRLKKDFGDSYSFSVSAGGTITIKAKTEGVDALKTGSYTTSYLNKSNVSQNAKTALTITAGLDPTWTVTAGKFEVVSDIGELADKTYTVNGMKFAFAKDATIKGLLEAADSSLHIIVHAGANGKATKGVIGDLAREIRLATGLDVRSSDGTTLKFFGNKGSGGAGGGLQLQIGDTSDAFNQLKVAVGDMHTNGAMKIEGVSIASINSAANAVDTVKDAINYVSGIRGTLGAIQNRLEHTQNNLSVMTENIQDAESTIRDTDVADEMMAYTKNNILIQSAQAMLAQANAVPQGVLQLLQ